MQPPRTSRPIRLCFTIWIVLAVTSVASSQSQRRIAVGDKTPAFTAADARGEPFSYSPNGGRPLLLAYLSSSQPRSVNAWRNLAGILADLPAEKVKTLQVAVVFGDTNEGLFAELSADRRHTQLVVIPDPEYRLWGTFGVIATPTVIVVGAGGELLLTKAGYSYDFEPVVKACLEKALGLRAEVNVEEVGRVSALDNASPGARAQRHERMAEILVQKGQNELAVHEFQKAIELDPNSVATAVRLGELLCLSGKPDDAIKAIWRWRDDASLPRPHRAAVLQVLGWAYRQQGRLDDAARYLQAATELDPRSPRTLFELAELAMKQDDPARALALYRKAARLLLDRQPQ